jgi:protein tyrosine/serine phosphatase
MLAIAVPLSGFFAPSDSDTNKILSILSDSSKYPIYLHCRHGEDRTGLMVGLYRVFYEDVRPAQAYDEMLKMGFHKFLLGLNRYFKEKT